MDSADAVRFCVVKDELDGLLSHEKMQVNDIPILFCCNKKDLPNAADTSTIAEALSVNTLNLPNNIVSTNGLSGDGLKEGLDWLSAMIDKNQSKRKHKKNSKNAKGNISNVNNADSTAMKSAANS